MSVCPVDENGFCSRHQVVHFGRLLEISQMDNEFGEKHRQLWDRKKKEPPAEPGLLKQAANFASALGKHVLNGMKHVSEDVRQERLEMCRACPYYDAETRKCKECGCPVEAKARWESENCPKGLWPLIQVEASGGCDCNRPEA